MKLAKVKEMLRAGPYIWPGGYQIHFICDDGGTLCFTCTKAEWKNVVRAYSIEHFYGYSDRTKPTRVTVREESLELTPAAPPVA